MAKNDYHVIVYRVLLYLYECLKQGKTPTENKFNEIALNAGIGERYWHYVLRTLHDMQLISGVIRVDVDGTYERIMKLEQAEITPAGIEYLTENSLLAKVKKFLKKTKDIAPFI